MNGRLTLGRAGRECVRCRNVPAASGKVGRLDEGLHALEEALAAVQHNDEHLYEAEVYRLKGELPLQAVPVHQEEAEEHFHQPSPALAAGRRSRGSCGPP
jgi:hypothetical protein